MQPTPRYQSDKLKERKRRLRKFKIAGSVILFVLLLGSVTYVTHLPGLRVEQIIVSDLSYTDRSAVELTIKEQLDGRYLGLFSKANSFIFPRRAIKRRILSLYPAIHNVNIDFRGRHTIAVRLTEHTPVAVWCDIPVTPAVILEHVDEAGDVTASLPQIPEDRTGSNCFFLNEQSVIFAQLKGSVPEGMVTFYGKIIKDPLRQTYAPYKEFTDLLDFTRLVRRLEIVITEVWTTGGEAYTFVTQSGTQLHIDSEDNLVEVFANLQTVIDRDAINKAQFGNIKYIDLRFGNRVFYKLR